jgi:hypothetical protein
MSGKRQFFPRGKYADSRPIGSFKLRFAWKDEGCFGKIHLTGQRLHLFVGQTPCVGENGQRIAGERRSGKNIKLNKIVAGSHLRKYLFV